MKLLSTVAACALVSAGIEGKTFLFPVPQEVEWSGTTATVAHNFRFQGIQNKNVQNAISYAAERGIRVILEIDMPAHTASIAESHSDYIICGDQFRAAYAAEPSVGQLNPISDDAFNLIKDVYLWYKNLLLRIRLSTNSI
jgi:hypothetical protein